jgi:lipopolysaccharide transport system ATP-binding protein
MKRGEVLGIIGKNGAGKSTLLKILSRVTGPTLGDIKVKGRIASLLEVGTGFHPELSGRENIFLNGAILGMTKTEIKSKFDEIVEFSGVERYIDTPVKRYSSGMYVRLAFAVAAHLEPEILIVDEVLAVGDAEFQKKCLGKMKDVSGEGRTVLFVSHNMGAVKELCTRALYLKNGEVHKIGETNEIIKDYMSNPVTISSANDFLKDDKSRRGNGEVRFTSIKINGGDEYLDPEKETIIEMEATVLKSVEEFFVDAFMAEQDSELANIKDEIVADVQQLKYLLTLK